VHYPANINKWLVFCLTYAGITIPTVFVAVLGNYVGGIITSNTDLASVYAEGGIGALILACMRPDGWAKFACVFLFLSFCKYFQGGMTEVVDGKLPVTIPKYIPTEISGWPPAFWQLARPTSKLYIILLKPLLATPHHDFSPPPSPSLHNHPLTPHNTPTVANLISNIYSSALSIQLWGAHFIAIPRFLWCFVLSIITLALALGGRNVLEPILTNLLALLGYWTLSFGAILSMKHFLFRKRLGGYDLSTWQDQRKMPWGLAGTGALLVGIGVSFAGMNQTWVRPVPGSVALCDMSSGIWTDFLFAIVYLAHRPEDRRLWWGCGGRADSRRDADLVSGIQVSRD